MTDTIRIAREEDLGRILELYARARVRMAENGNPDQWGTSWPEEWKVREDMENIRAALREKMIKTDFGTFGIFGKR